MDTPNYNVSLNYNLDGRWVPMQRVLQSRLVNTSSVPARNSYQSNFSGTYRPFSISSKQNTLRKPALMTPKKETKNNTLVPVYQKEHDGVTPIPISLLREIVQTIGFDPNSNRSGPDGCSDHSTAKGLERTAFMILGDKIVNWEQKLASRDSGYNNERLGRRVYSCFRPLLSVNEGWLAADAIMDALQVYEEDSNLHYASYGPFCSDFMFTEKLFTKISSKYSFVFCDAKTEDRSNLKGSHYTVLFVDTLENELDFYDSMGSFPNQDLRHAMSRIISVLRKRHPNISKEINFTRQRKQMGSEECSVYVVHFVIQRLLGKSFKTFSGEYLPDAEIRKYRNVYWTLVDKPLFEINS